MSNDVRAGDVEIKKLVMSNINGKQRDITPQVQAISMYENIYKYSLYAEFRVTDYVELMSEFPIMGEEEIEVIFETPGAINGPISYTFHTVGINNVTTLKDDKGKSYVIRATTRDNLINSTKVFTRRYRKPDHEPHKVVSSIVKEHFSLTVETEECRGYFDKIINKLHPFEAIDMVRRRAVSKDYESSNFVFYQDRHGYNFTTIEKLVDTRKEKIGDKTFWYKPIGNNDDVTEKDAKRDIRNIIALKNISTGNNVSKLKRQAFASKTKTLDIITGKIEEIVYINSQSQQKFKNADKKGHPMNSSIFENAYTDEKAAQRFFMVKDTSKDQDFTERKIGPALAYGNRVNTQVMEINIYGDTEINVGDVIEINLPEIHGFTAATKKNKFYSSNYLITSLCHYLEMSGSSPEHFISCRVVKTNLVEKIV